MAAAAKHLTPVTLELGGKNPCYVSDTCDVQNVARQVARGCFFNAGQTCAAPNYVPHSTDMLYKLLPALREAIAEYYGPNPWEPPDFACVVGDKQFQRAQALLCSGHAAIGGQTDAEARYIAPTALVDVQQDEPLMQEEFFGPILPILTVASGDDDVTFINTQARPLALYIFSSCKKAVNRVPEQTSSGSFCANDTIMHVTLTSLPFGGTGTSIPRNRVRWDTPPPRPAAPSAWQGRGPARSRGNPAQSPSSSAITHRPARSRSLLPRG
ncbi:aldehyde dehydrogenase family 3 member B1-like [Aptenodytes patagonicus]|uniref:aldehyde dehydrogenase family 3 member B1-like n=1 Tax=Aptenodytes patagonicus TaxID=9234 RepID=UPI003F9F102C